MNKTIIKGKKPLPTKILTDDRLETSIWFKHIKI